MPAAKQFVGQFSDAVDQVGLVHFSTMAETAMQLQFNFTSKAKKRIDQMKPSGDTNGEEALSFAWGELASKRARPKALKVIVFFTDGRPTAFRDNDAKMGKKDGILTASPRHADGDGVLGWYSAAQDPPSSIRPDDDWKRAAKCSVSPLQPCAIPGGSTWLARRRAGRRSREAAGERRRHPQQRDLHLLDRPGQSDGPQGTTAGPAASCGRSPT